MSLRDTLQNAPRDYRVFFALAIPLVFFGIVVGVAWSDIISELDLHETRLDRVERDIADIKEDVDEIGKAQAVQASQLEGIGETLDKIDRKLDHD